MKGSIDLLNLDTEKSFIKTECSSYGFQALTNDVAEVKALLGNRVVIEEATLEDIMFYAKGTKHQNV
ncbi:hypothetical protein [Oceanobacillus sp. J11TS1]|uniref:hypothetical protein n=1 Tax=Oceanobacillus sp. J11TS1 TaxID=2807191 RepID=UPI001B29AEB0|nr:hypothetical protein [Oceanobacillus sp. J11TS1]GIO23386.1 hypothetical protein J11TS1_19670 [Oceanobacillus sp. J11TS1]